MRLKINFLFIVSAMILLFSGCSKDAEEYNKPAMYWYGKMIDAIVDSDLEKADGYYSSLQGEHIGSPLLPEATMILAIAHMQYEEYILSEHFFNEYVKRYANTNEKEYAEFMKIKAKYRALPNPRRDQVLIQEAIKESEVFKLNYPRSMYYPVVDTMLTNLKMAEALLNETIADLYIRLDKPRSAEYYRNKKPQPWIKWDEVERERTSWYRAWFEGDGTDSWYAFMIPDTQALVSRNSIQEEFTPQEVSEQMQKDIQEETIERIDEGIQEVKLTAKQENQLTKAQGLYDNGVLSEAEFIEIKKEILTTTAASEPYFKTQDITQKTFKQKSQLKEAESLYEDGIINEEEYLNLKDEILNK